MAALGAAAQEGWELPPLADLPLNGEAELGDDLRQAKAERCEHVEREPAKGRSRNPGP